MTPKAYAMSGRVATMVYMILPTTDAQGILGVSSYIEGESLFDSQIYIGSSVGASFAFSMLKHFNTFADVAGLG